MFSSIRNIFKIHELRQRILFTLGLLVVYRVGGHIPTPGVDLTAIKSFNPGGLFNLYDLFVGGAFTKVTIFSLGIMPYISASIIIQLLGANELKAGIIWVNCWMLRDLRTPFGGVKNSGVGREGGFEALRFFTEPKNVCIKFGD